MRSGLHVVERASPVDAPNRRSKVRGASFVPPPRKYPVPKANSWTGDPWCDHTAEAMADVTPVGTESAVNLELVAALEPDLILGNQMRHE